MIKNPPAKWEMRVRSLGQEDPLEMAIYSSILARKYPMDRGARQASPWGLKELDTTEHVHTSPPRRLPIV